MAQLSDVVSFFSRSIRTLDGRVIRGVVQTPKREPRSYDGTFVPRLLLKTAPREVVRPGDILLDRDSQRFIVAPFTEDTFFDSLVKRSWVLFQINADMIWTRPTQVVEPISGLGTPGPDLQLGTIPCLKENTGVRSDVLRVDVPTYRVLTPALVQLGDSLDGHLVKQINRNPGITNAHTL